MPIYCRRRFFLRCDVKFWPRMGGRLVSNFRSFGMQAFKIFGMIFGVLYLIGSFSGSESSQQASIENPCGDSTGAWVAAKTFVKRNLKNPRSAEFAWSSGSSGVSINAHDCQWTVASYVDATNSFGGTIRSQWALTVKRESNGDWRLVDGPAFF